VCAVSEVQWQILGVFVFTIMGITSYFAHEVRRWNVPNPFPSSGKPLSRVVLPTILCAFLALLLAAVDFGLNGHYTTAACLFFASWVCATASAWFAFGVLSRKARAWWTICVFLFAGGVFFRAYKITCPTLTISPSRIEFRAHNEWFQIRLSNKSDADVYAAAFMFQVQSNQYPANEFVLDFRTDSLKALPSQPPNANRTMSDTWIVIGNSVDGSHPIQIVYIYHLAPHESRGIPMQFTGHSNPTDPPVITAKVMSYSGEPEPINSLDADSVAIPIGITEPMTIVGVAACDIVANTTLGQCHIKGVNSPIMSTGCYYLAVSNKELPHSMPNLGCDIGN